MNKLNKSPRALLALASKGEKGFTLMEILVALAIIAVIVAVTAATLGGRATDTRLESIASAVAQTVQGTQQLFVNDLRQAQLTDDELAGRLSTALTPLVEVSTVQTAGAAGCSGTSGQDASISLTMTAPGATGGLEAAEQVALQALITTQINNLFDGIAATDPGGYEDVVDGADSGQTTLDAATAASANTIYICLED